MFTECSPPVSCHLSFVMCHVSTVTCHLLHVYFFFNLQMVELVDLLSTGPTPSGLYWSPNCSHIINHNRALQSHHFLPLQTRKNGSKLHYVPIPHLSTDTSRRLIRLKAFAIKSNPGCLNHNTDTTKQLVCATLGVPTILTSPELRRRRSWPCYTLPYAQPNPDIMQGKL